MKNAIKLIAISILTLVFHCSYSQCKTRALVSSHKGKLKPFMYDGYVFNNIEIKEKPQKIEVEFTAFLGQEYKLIFAPTEFDQKLELKIYSSQGYKDKRRVKVFDSNDLKNSIDWIYEPKEPGDYFIEYEVPAAKKPSIKKGCVVILIGTGLLGND